MKSFQKILGLFILSLIILISGKSYAQTADQFVEQGKTEFFTNQNISQALFNFDSALALDPFLQKALFWRGTIGLADVVNNSDVSSILQNLEIFDGLGNLLIFDDEDNINQNFLSTVNNIIIDNSDAEYSETGTWTTLVDTASSLNTYNVDARSIPLGIGNNKAQWTPNIVTAGYYNIYVWIPANPSNTYSAEYQIKGTSKNKLLNQ